MKIILIDDDKTTLLVTKAMLNKNLKGLSIDACASLNDVPLAELNMYDAIICDDDLGKTSAKNGLEFLKSLDNYNGIKILLTGNDTLGMYLKVFTASNINYVLKNINTPQNNTIATLISLLTQQSLNKE